MIEHARIFSRRSHREHILEQHPTASLCFPSTSTNFEAEPR
jgi:hypothetical protein